MVRHLLTVSIGSPPDEPNAWLALGLAKSNMLGSRHDGLVGQELGVCGEFARGSDQESMTNGRGQGVRQKEEPSAKHGPTNAWGARLKDARVRMSQQSSSTGHERPSTRIEALPVGGALTERPRVQEPGIPSSSSTCACQGTQSSTRHTDLSDRSRARVRSRQTKAAQPTTCAANAPLHRHCAQLDNSMAQVHVNITDNNLRRVAFRADKVCVRLGRQLALPQLTLNRLFHAEEQLCARTGAQLQNLSLRRPRIDAKMAISRQRFDIADPSTPQPGEFYSNVSNKTARSAQSARRIVDLTTFSPPLHTQCIESASCRLAKASAWPISRKSCSSKSNARPRHHQQMLRHTLPVITRCQLSEVRSGENKP